MRTTKTSRLIRKGLSLLPVLLIINSCSKKDDSNPIPEPTPTEITYIDNISSDREDQVFIHYKNGKELAHGTTTNAEKTATLTFTQKKYDELTSKSSKTTMTSKGSSSAIVIDSTIGKFGGEVIYRELNRSINSGTNSIDITNKQEKFSHIFTWYGNNSKSTWTPYKNGKAIEVLPGSESPISMPHVKLDMIFFDDENTTTLDSIKGVAPGFKDITITDITIKDQFEYLDGPGALGEFLFMPDETAYNNTGDFAITPLIDSDNDGVGDTPIFNTSITARNKITNKMYEISTSESAAEFYNVDVEMGNPMPYEITIASTQADPTFFPTSKEIFIYRDDAETGYIVNGNIQVIVDKVENEQDISVSVRDFNDINQKVSGYQVELRNYNNDELLGVKVTSGFEDIVFEDVPGQTDVYVVGYKNGYYTKTNGKYSIPLVEFVSQTQKKLNVVAVQKFNDRDGVPVSADDINMYKPLKDNTEAALDKLRIYFPEGGEREVAIEQVSNAANLLGVDLTVSTNFQGYPSQNMVDSYNPYPQERQVFDGQIETNVTGYAGTATGTGGKILPNGNEISFYTSTFNLGGNDESANHHEFGNLLNFPLLSGFNTSRAELAGVTTSIDDSKLDSAIMPLWIQLQKYHYNSTDSENNLIEYNMATKFSE